jgi:hypothetical protein
MGANCQKNDRLIRQPFTEAIITIGFPSAFFSDHKDDAEVHSNTRTATTFEIELALFRQFSDPAYGLAIT